MFSESDLLVPSEPKATRRVTKEWAESLGWVEGEHFYVNHSGIVISLIQNENRACDLCGHARRAAQYYSALHKGCRACLRRAKDGVSVGSPLIKAREIALAESSAGHETVAQARNRVQAHDKELATRVLARRRLVKFVERFHPGYSAGWVHKDICRRLERFLERVAAGLSPRLLLFCPPRLGKSLLSSQYFPAFALGHYPEFEIIAASYNITLPIGFSRRIRELVRDPSYTSMFAKTKLSEDSQAVESWRTTAGGGYTAAGVGTGITGKGAHILIVDDPIKDWEAASSAMIREGCWEWYLSTAYTRLAPGGGILGIQTRWNDDDWAGRIILAMDSGEDGEHFEVVSYPAINEVGDEYLLADDTIAQIAPGLDVPPDAQLLRARNSALHPERYTLEHLQRIQKNYRASGNTRMWSALYQQNPVPEEGAFFRKDMMKYIAYMPETKGMHVYQAWDFAITEKKQNDWIVGYCIMQDDKDNIYELDMVRFKSDDTIIISDAILDFQQKWNAWLVGFEDGQIWKATKAILMRRCAERKLNLNYETLVPFTDKLVRAGPLRGRMQMGKMYFQQDASFGRERDNELLRFPAGKHDDIVDAAAWAMRLALAHAAPTRREPKKIKGWRDKLATGVSGASHMAA